MPVSRLQIGTFLITIVIVAITLYTAMINQQSLVVSRLALEESIRLPNLLIDSRTTEGDLVTFDDKGGAYLRSSIFDPFPGDRSDELSDVLEIKIWNIGDKTASDIAVQIFFTPQNASLFEILNTRTCERGECVSVGRDIFDPPSLLSSTTLIRAILPGEFATVSISFKLYAMNITSSAEDVDLFIIATSENPSEQFLYRYRIAVDFEDNLQLIRDLFDER
ncbi:MAG: hypothetical protein V3U49_01270 [Nitrososphaerales archaeon]